MFPGSTGYHRRVLWVRKHLPTGILEFQKNTNYALVPMVSGDTAYFGGVGYEGSRTRSGSLCTITFIDIIDT